MNPLYPHVRAAITARPWLILPEVMDVITEVLSLRLAGQRFTDDEIADRIAASGLARGPRAFVGPTSIAIADVLASGQRMAAGSGGAEGKIAVIPIYGVIAHRASLLEDTSQSGTSIQGLQQAFRSALDNPEVKAILFDVDSPGGYSSGVPEFADEIRGARGPKPMAAVSNTLMASAAYYLASQADEVIVSPSSYTGSIGVYTLHEDRSAQQEMLGIKTTYIHAGEYKVEGNPLEPLSEEAAAYAQEVIDEVYAGFVAAVSKGRAVGVQTVRDDFGKGRVLTARASVKVGMADRIGTFDDALRRLARGQVTPRAATPAEPGAQDVGASYRMAAAEPEAEDVAVPHLEGHADATVALALARARVA